MPHIHELYDFTASALMVHPTEPRICILFHSKLKSWLQPGGHVELHEHPLDALKHEMEEEVGFLPDDYEIVSAVDVPKVRGSTALPLPVHFNVHNVVGMHKHIDMMFHLRAKRTDFQPAEGESQVVRWATLEEIKELNREGTLLDGTLDIFEWFFTRYV